MSTHTSNCSTPSEESGWSTYIEELLVSSQIIREEEEEAFSASANSCYSSISSSDSTSRCASLKRKKIQSFNNKAEATSDVIDDPLEDTATSLITNNKANNQVFGHLDMMEQSNKHNKDHVSQEKITKSMEVKSGGRDDIGTKCNELRKRGLCLVPVSMLLEYLG